MSHQPTYDDELVEIKKLDNHVVPVIAEPPPHVPLRSVKPTFIKRNWDGEAPAATTTRVRTEVWLLLAGVLAWFGMEIFR